MYGKSLLNKTQVAVTTEAAKHHAEVLCPALDEMVKLSGKSWCVTEGALLDKALIKSFFEGGAVACAGVAVGTVCYKLFKKKRTNKDQEKK